MKWRTTLGISLIVLSLALMLFWEFRGRDVLTMTQILTASRDILPGERLLAQDVASTPVPPENVIQGALAPSDAKLILGRNAIYPLSARQQLSASYFKEDQDILRRNESIFPIRPQWIGSMSGAVRPGDVVSLVSSSSEEGLGMYRVAYVMDQAGGLLEWPAADAGDLLGRSRGPDPAASLEIVCTLEDYLNILRSQTAAAPKDLIVFMEGGL